MSKWIDVNDRLPENTNLINDSVVFTCGSVVRNGCYDYEDGFWHERYGGRYIDVSSHMKDKINGGWITHWMNLPEPPNK